MKLFFFSLKYEDYKINDYRPFSENPRIIISVSGGGQNGCGFEMGKEVGVAGHL